MKDPSAALANCAHQVYDFVDCEDSQATYKCSSCDDIQIIPEDCGSGG